MPQQKETRKFTGGIDANTAPFAMEPNTLLNAGNIRALLSDGQHTGELQQVLGNTEVTVVTAVLPSGTNTLIGKWADPETNCLYLFYYNSTSLLSLIVEYNKTTGAARRVIDDTKVTGTLEFTATMFISARVVAGLLVWTSNAQDIRYLNLATDYMAGSAISHNTLSIATEPGIVPITEVRGSVAGPSTIQFQPIQFTYSFSNTDGLMSVLAPLSLTSLPARASAVAVSSYDDNVITATIPLTQQVPANWQRVNLVAKYLNTGIYFVIKYWDRNNPDDVTAVNLHNAGTTALSIASWSGTTLEVLSEAYTSLAFNSIPRTARHLETAVGRIFAGGVLAGYDTPVIKPGFSVLQNTYTAPPVTSGSTQNVYEISASYEYESGKYDIYYAYVLRMGGLNYLLPDDRGSAGIRRWLVPAAELPVVWSVPLYIHQSFLKLLSETGDPDLTNGNSGSVPIQNIRIAILNEANGTTIDMLPEILAVEPYSVAKGTVEIITTDPPEFGPSGESRLFLPNTSYPFGIQYYDDLQRKSGVLELGNISIPEFSLADYMLTESISFTINNTVVGAIPSWATKYAIVLGFSNKTQGAISFIPGIIKVVLRELNTQALEYRGWGHMQAPGNGKEFYGLAIPITSLRNIGFGYSPSPGDFIELSGVDNSGAATLVLSGNVLEMVEGYIIMSADLSNVANLNNIIPEEQGGSNRQSVVFATIFSPITSPQLLYEVAKFGVINTSLGVKSFGNFYDSGALTTVIYGDHYTQKRTSSAGAGTAYGKSTYERDLIFPVNDHGRLTPVDTVGERNLESAIVWSNVHIQGASINGFASFDALDIKMVDEKAGQITGMVLVSQGKQQGAQMLVVCQHNSFTALVGQQQLTDAGQQHIATIAGNVLSDFNPTEKGFGSNSPRSIERYQNRVFGVDAFNKEVWEFNPSGQGSISSFKASRLFQQLLARVLGTTDEQLVTCGVSPFHRELMVSIPASTPSNLPDLNTVTGLPNPFNSYINQPATFCYNYETNAWQQRYDTGNEFMNLGDAVFGWSRATGKLYREFIGALGTYNGVAKTSFICVPFNEGAASASPITKSPRALYLKAGRAPDACWLMTDDEDGLYQHVASAGPWEKRDGKFYAKVRRDRTSNAAVTSPAWNAAGVNGKNLKGEVIYCVMIWNAGGVLINASSVTLEWAPVSGH